jgi:hypothetical protein
MSKQISTHTDGQFFISVNGNRPKQYASNVVYLEDLTEFQLELFNPTQKKLLAKIKMNGDYISKSGIVLKPGQRVFLDRYLDEAKKFKYETYKIDKTPETESAIANNGLVEVEFYQEYVDNSWTLNQSTYLDPIYYKSPIINPPYTITCGTGIPITNIPSSYNTTTTTINLNETSTLSNNSTYSCVGAAYINAGSPYPTVDTSSFLDSSVSNSIETGRVEKGSKSNQSFVDDNSTYNSYCSSKMSWKILPTSQKPYEVEELTKKHCVFCRTKIKKSVWKFCPSCGEKITEETNIIYTDGVCYTFDDKKYFMSEYRMTLDKFLEKNKGKTIIIKKDSINELGLRAIVI